MAKAGTIVLAVVLALVAVQPQFAGAQQQNPLVGIWSTRVADAYGRVQGVAYVQFGPNGAVYRKIFPRSVGTGGAIFQEWGVYRFVPGRPAIQLLIQRYAPRQCAMGLCEAYMPYVGRWIITYFQVQGPNTLAFTDQGNSGPPQVFIRAMRIP
jgi:hypothetical protein